MIELFGEYRPWDREALQAVTKRVVAGAEITVCNKEKDSGGNPVCWLNKYQAKPQQIHYYIAQVFIYFGIVGIDSGNGDTGEDHYTYFMR